MEETIITAQEARDIAAQWGSLMTSGDPGYVFYTLTGKADQINDEEHRQNLIAYCKDCIALNDTRKGEEDYDDNKADGRLARRVLGRPRHLRGHRRMFDSEAAKLIEAIANVWRSGSERQPSRPMRRRC